MKASLVFFSVGIIAASYLEKLPQALPLYGSCCFVFFCLIVFYQTRKYLLIPFAGLLGFTYGIFSGYQALDNQLSFDLQERELIVRGYVAGLPHVDDRRQLFQLLVENAALTADVQPHLVNESLKFPKEISIALYDSKETDAIKIQPGDYWQFRVKVKRPRSMVNPKGYDYEVAQIRNGIGATAYVKNESVIAAENNNRQIQNQQESYFCFIHLLICVDKQRYQFRDWLVHQKNISQVPLLVALLIGDTSLLAKDDWNLYLQTGTLHLIAISGLHLGFFAIIGFWLGSLVGRSISIFWNRCDGFLLGHLCAFLLVITYSFMAGLNIPTLRTLIMLLVVQLAWVLKRNPPSFNIWLTALVAVLLVDPFSAYDKGFWLSFIAVGLLIFYFSGRKQVRQNKQATENNQALENNQLQNNKQIKDQIIDVCLEFIKSQWLMLIGLIIPLLLLSTNISWCAPIANLIAIPLVTFFVVPCLILSAVLHLVFNDAALPFLNLADWGAVQFQHWLTFVVQLSTSLSSPEAREWNLHISMAQLLFAVLCILLILLPKGLRNLWIGFGGLFICLCLPVEPRPPLQILIFDVGQGTAVLVRTAQHQLLYDTGPKYSENFDAGGGIIQPYLQSEGLNRLDGLVVSHNDQDHSGGLVSLLNLTQIDYLYLGQPDQQTKLGIEKYLHSVQHTDTCHQQKSWQWEQVNFKFIDYEINSTKPNNQSCVLLIEFAGQKVLLAGDIEQPVEQKLLDYAQLNALTFLLAPHHGSHTSSSEKFVTFTHPKYVIYSAGYHNQHGHPHKDVEQRYQGVGSFPLNTAYTGALDFVWTKSGQLEISAYRKSHRHYWFWDDQL